MRCTHELNKHGPPINPGGARGSSALNCPNLKDGAPPHTDAAGGETFFFGRAEDFRIRRGEQTEGLNRAAALFTRHQQDEQNSKVWSSESANIDPLKCVWSRDAASFSFIAEKEHLNGNVKSFPLAGSGNLFILVDAPCTAGVGGGLSVGLQPCEQQHLFL